jgi:hypothetical protein
MYFMLFFWLQQPKFIDNAAMDMRFALHLLVSWVSFPFIYKKHAVIIFGDSE